MIGLYMECNTGLKWVKGNVVTYLLLGDLSVGIGEVLFVNSRT